MNEPMEPNEKHRVLKLATNRPDIEIVEELRAELLEAYKPVIDVLNKCKKHGFIVNSQIADSPMGIIMQNLQFLKSF